MNIKFKVVDLTRLKIIPESTAPEANALTTRPSELPYTISQFARQKAYFAEIMIFPLKVMPQHRGGRLVILSGSGFMFILN